MPLPYAKKLGMDSHGKPTGHMWVVFGYKTLENADLSMERYLSHINTCGSYYPNGDCQATMDHFVSFSDWYVNGPEAWRDYIDVYPLPIP